INLELEINPSQEGSGAEISLEEAKEKFVNFLGGGIRGYLIDYSLDNEAFLPRIRIKIKHFNELLYSGDWPEITYYNFVSTFGDNIQQVINDFDIDFIEQPIDEISSDAPVVCIIDS